MTGPMPPPRELPVICCLPHLNQRWQTLELKTSYYTLVKLHQYQLSGCYIIFNKMNLSFFFGENFQISFCGGLGWGTSTSTTPHKSPSKFWRRGWKPSSNEVCYGVNSGPSCDQAEVWWGSVAVVVWVVVSLSVGFGCVCCFWKVVM